MRARADLRDRMTLERLERLVPDLMRQARIDMWIVFGREYNEDPVLRTMLPATWLSARRRTILMFFDRGAEHGVERLAVARYDIGAFFTSAWDKSVQPDQWARLVELVVEREPERIAWNVSPDFALADGVTLTEGRALQAALPAEYRERLVSAEALAIGWLERRSRLEVNLYADLCKLAHAIIAEGFSANVVRPGETSTHDVEWWFRDRFRALRLDTWFHPTVSLQRRQERASSGSFASSPGDTVIEVGDLLHVDLGITYLGLNTDTQQHAYVLRSGETGAPQYLRDALALGNQMQDILCAQFQIGLSGNQILARALTSARTAGLVPTIYTHPLGLHGHGAGTTIGLWDQQDGVPGRGDFPLHDETAHSIELNVAVELAEWDGQDVRIMLEEDAFFDGQSVSYFDGRQTEFLLIGAPPVKAPADRR